MKLNKKIMMKKILIVTPDMSFAGGVANHYLGLSNYLDKKQVIYCQILTAVNIKKYVTNPSICRLIQYITTFRNLCLFCTKMMLNPSIRLVLLNPSLQPTSIRRDALFLTITKLLRKKAVVFFHGWDEKTAITIQKKPESFVSKYNKADMFLVLANEFSQKLKEFGITKKICLTTTKVNDVLIEDFNIKKRTGIVRNILFLARVEVEKGIYIAIDSFRLLKEKYSDLTLTVVGAGKELEKAQLYVQNNNIKGIIFKGSLNGAKLINSYIEADLYILPTFHGEGMPTSVLEAMAFGLPIITRPVGGLNDIFIPENMGFLVESFEPADYAKLIQLFIENPDFVKSVGEYNHKYAKENFMASTVAKKLEAVFQFVLLNNI